MTRTLTLELADEVAALAEEISRATGRSVSEVVSDLLSSLPQVGLDSGDQQKIPGLTPIVKSLIGVLKGSGLDEEDYYRHLEERYP